MKDIECTKSEQAALLQGGLLDEEQEQKFLAHLLECQYCRSFAAGLVVGETSGTGERELPVELVVVAKELNPFAKDSVNEASEGNPGKRLFLRFAPWVSFAAVILLFSGYLLIDSGPLSGEVMRSGEASGPRLELTAPEEGVEYEKEMSLVWKPIERVSKYRVTVSAPNGDILDRQEIPPGKTNFVVSSEKLKSEPYVFLQVEGFLTDGSVERSEPRKVRNSKQ